MKVKIDISQSPIHAAAPPAHSDRQTLPFIIPLAIPQLTVGVFFFLLLLFSLSSLCIAYVHWGFLTYFCLHCNEMPAVEKMGGGFANRGREGGRREEGGKVEALKHFVYIQPWFKKIILADRVFG